MPPIYFDYNATTPLDPEVFERMRPFFGEVFGNPSSIHQVGRRARALLDEARDRLARVWKCRPSEIIFTSGGTESINLAIFGMARWLRPKGKHLISSPTEHHAVLHSLRYLAEKEGFDVTYLPVDSEGQIDPNDLRMAIRPDTTIVSVMSANNETGALQPVRELAGICREHGVYFHTDAVQFFGKEPVARIQDFNAHLVSACGHKFHGPKGAGALFIESPLHPDPILFGGGHENERRAGTENLAAIVGFVEAIERFTLCPVFPRERLLALTERLRKLEASVEGVQARGSRANRLSNTVAFTVAGCDSIALLAGLDLEGVCASSGSACSAGSLEPSHVLSAMGVGSDLANSLVRFSLGRESTETQVDQVVAIFPRIIERIRR